MIRYKQEQRAFNRDMICELYFQEKDPIKKWLFLHLYACLYSDRGPKKNELNSASSSHKPEKISLIENYFSIKM